MDLNDPASYRPISNLNFLSKVVEKVVDGRLWEHIMRHRQLPVRQSAYGPFHSTKATVISIHSDMMGVVDQDHIGALVLLDLSAAFDTVDHSILMNRDVTRLRLGGAQAPPNDVAAPQTETGISRFFDVLRLPQTSERG